MTVPSSLIAINQLIGGYEEGLHIGLFGPSMSGKSTLLCQEAFFFAKQGGFGTIFVDTEGGLIKLIKMWQPIFEKRFDINVSVVELNMKSFSQEKIEYIFNPKEFEGIPLIVSNFRAVVKLLAFFGIDSEIKISKEGKHGFRYLGDHESFCEQLLKEYNIKNIVIDSLTNPINVFSGGLINYPARADVEKQLFRKFQEIIDIYFPVFIMAHHMSQDPHNPWSLPDISGGKIIRHNTKISLYLEQTQSTKDQSIRWLWLDRWFNQPRFGEKRKIKITKEGFVDAE